MAESPEGRRRPPRGGMDTAAIAMALMVASRVATPLIRSLGPAGRHLVLGAVAVVLPLGLGVRTLRRRAEEREIAELRRKRAERRRRRSGGS